MILHRWNQIEKEQMNPSFSRQVIHTERMTIAQVFLKKGSVVPRHHHENEQVTLLQQGRLRFVFDDGERLLEGGEAMQIPPHAPHEVIAIEDSVAFDLFDPVRADWLRGDDAYLRR
ncbi:MAG: cupin domain-containing protein [Acidobacteriia bacterium]|nr:cupin domain-containing protein [Terriglobia bacterium]